MNALNGMDRRNGVRFSKNWVLKQNPFGDALPGPTDEIIEYDKTYQCSDRFYRSSTRKQSKHCGCVESETIHITVPMVELTEEEISERKEHGVLNHCSKSSIYAAPSELNEIEWAIEAVY
jgi:hypothetical protein